MEATPREEIESQRRELTVRRKELGELAAILADALRFSPPLYVNSILGLPWTWLPPYDETSEFSILSPRDFLRTFEYLIDVTVPAIPAQLPEVLPGVGDAVFWRPTQILFQTDPEGDPYSFPDEAWIFVNGVATNHDMARINSEYLASLFRRPMTVIQNATDSIGVDLVECVVGKSWHAMTEPSTKAYPFVLKALENERKRRVVVICHSQGTIIMSNVLRALLSDDFRDELFAARPRPARILGPPEPRGLEDQGLLQKLEIYAFANCADVMPYAPAAYVTPRGHRVPWIENFGNEYDVVARCGMLAPHKARHGILIDGPSYVREGMWGHLLNESYLKGIERHLASPDARANPYPPEAPAGGMPRLYGYFQGRTPEPY